MQFWLGRESEREKRAFTFLKSKKSYLRNPIIEFFQAYSVSDTLIEHEKTDLTIWSDLFKFLQLGRI